MKRIIRTIIALALVICTAAALTGCGADSKPAAKVGTRTVTVRDLKNVYTNNLSYAAYYGSDTETPEGRRAFLESMLDNLIRSTCEDYQAEAQGLTLTDEEKEQVKTTAADDYDQFIQQFVDYAKESGASDPEIYANKMLAESLAKNGMTIAKMKEDFLKSETDKVLAAKLKEQIMDGVEPTEEDIKEMYDNEVEAQQQALEEDPSYYFTCENYYNYGYTYPGLVLPEGLFYVRQILVEDEETAKEVLDKINAGEDFEALLAEYNTDPGMDANPDGYIVGEGANFVQEFLDASLALENEGDVSEAVKSEFGYHIIKRMGNVEAGVIPYEKVKDNFELMAKNNFLTKYYDDIVTGWAEDDSIVTRYPENYLSIVD